MVKHLFFAVCSLRYVLYWYMNISFWRFILVFVLYVSLVYRYSVCFLLDCVVAYCHFGQYYFRVLQARILAEMDIRASC